jgi:hexosaminidase
MSDKRPADLYPIIPSPAKIEPRSGEFIFTSRTTILAGESNRENAKYLKNLLAPGMGFALPTHPIKDGITNAIRLRIDPELSDLKEGGYQLLVQPEVIDIQAPTRAGVFYGIQTLRQLLPIDLELRKLDPQRKWIVPGVRITDKPRFAWRGYMLDEGRHFLGKENIIRTLDLLALHKINILHWHLTEDQGWRIEIKRYPKLIEIGSHRPGTTQTMMGMFGYGHDGIPHSGYYTQEEIREIVAYAATRQITIVPEIELPGHSLAALAAYPELSCTGGPFEVATRFGIHNDIYCAGKETTFEFLWNVLDEVVDLFLSPFIHIGGDEAPKTRWKKCPDCQRRIREEGLANEGELQTYMVNRIGEFLKTRDRHLMGWNQILQESLSSESLVQYWLGNKKKMVQAVKNGQLMVNSAFLDTYLDHSYNLTPLSRAYNFEPVFPHLDSESLRNVLGLEAPMWTEWVPNRDRLDYQTYPRLTAFAETGWTLKSLKNYDDFRRRLTQFLKRLDLLGVRYAPISEWDPPWYRRIFGVFTIILPQRKVSPQRNAGFTPDKS